MKLRYTTAILAGTLGFVLTMMAGWAFTEIEFLKMMLGSLLVYFGVYMAVLVLTEPKKVRHERTRWNFVTYNLKTGGR